MKNMNLQRDKKGQTLLEIIAVLVIIGAILAAVIPAVSASTDTGRVNSALSGIRSIQSAAVGYYNDNGGTYAAISVAGLTAKYLPAGFTGTSANPWSGNIGIAGVTGVSNQYTITLNNVPSTAQTQLAKALQNSAVSTTPNATTTPTSTTFTATFS